MRYEIDGDDLCIRLPLKAIADAAVAHGLWDDTPIKVKDTSALALAMGRELCECENVNEQFYLSETLDDALRRVIESADPSIEFEEEAKEPVE